MSSNKPRAEVLIEGELSPFEHEMLYRILRKSFNLEQPSYTELQEDSLTTLVNVTFHYPYESTFFTEVFRENWRELKSLFKNIQYRRGRAGAAFKLRFIGKDSELTFIPGTLDNDDAILSAMDQIGHLTGIVKQMIGPQTTSEGSVRFVKAFYDKNSDRWNKFTGLSSNKQHEYVFNEESFRWIPVHE